MKIKIKVQSSRVGYLTLTPVRELYCRKIIRYFDEMHNQNNSEPSALIQSYCDVQMFYEDYPHTKKDLEAGWDRTILMDAWEFLLLLGWDANTLAESGELFRQKDSPEYWKN